MATTLDFTNSVDKTDAAAYIPALWSDQVIAAYKANLVLAGLVNTIPHNGKKGDTIHIPSFTTYPTASAKAANNVVTLSTITDTNIDVLLNKHYAVAVVREDIVDIQALDSWRASFSDRMGYALAVQVDTDIRDLAATWNSGTAYSGAYIGSDGSTAYNSASTGNGTALSDAGIRRALQRLDDGDVPFVDRVLVVPPVEKKRLLDIPKLVEQMFVGEVGDANSIRNGLVGDVYGTKVYMSTRIAEVTAADGSTKYRACLLFQKQALALAMQQQVKMEEQRKVEALGTMVVGSVLYGVKTIREAGCDAFMVPSI
ncbi:MAG TPA: phage capsid protein [Nitrospiraceae bacterium]|nr:phage capsid protein [Nitrospiraceae bacterium]